MALSSKLKWIGGIASAVLAGLIVEWVKDFPVLRWLGGIVVAIWHWLWAPGALPHVVILLLSAFAVMVLLRFTRLMVKPHDIPELEYNSDSFLGLNWQWYYTHGRIADHCLVPICPQCQMQMVFQNASYFRAVPKWAVVCEDCGYSQEFEFNDMELREKVIRLIQRNLRTGAHLQKALAAQAEKRKSK